MAGDNQATIGDRARDFANANRDPNDRPGSMSRRDFYKVLTIAGTALITAGYAQKEYHTFSRMMDYLSDMAYPGEEKELMFTPYTVKKDDTVWELLKGARDVYDERTGKGDGINLRDLYARTARINKEHPDYPDELDELYVGEDILIPEILIK